MHAGNSAGSAADRAFAEVARIRAARERHLVQRAEMQKRAAEIVNRPPAYILKKYGGQQLALDLAGGNAGQTH